MIHPFDRAVTDLQSIPIEVPRLAKGKGYKGPEFYGCFNTGMAPCIFHSRTGKYVVGPELCCREAMRIGLLLQNTRTSGEGLRQIWIFRTRKAAVTKFVSLAIAQETENLKIRKQHAETARRARAGDMTAVLALGDF